MRVLVGGVGYRYLRDGHLGLYIVDTLTPHATNGIEFEDLGYHPIGFIQNLEARTPYVRIVFVGAVARGRPHGTVEAYKWDHEIPDRDGIQERVAEAVTGVISLDNLLIISEAFKVLPDDVRVVEAEPADEGWGEGFSPEIEAKLPEIEELVWSLTTP